VSSRVAPIHICFLARMRPGLKVVVTALTVAAMMAPATAIADVTDVTFAGGSLTGLEVDPAFSQGSFQKPLLSP
jgi:hypothetical protein